MMGTTPIPKHHELKPYNLAVAGHDGTLVDSQGELFIKPCTEQELNFYKTANESHPAFADLMPVFMGELELNDVEVVEEEKKSTKIKTNKSVVLENSAYGYSRPNILDAKLGTVLFADDASDEKKERFRAISESSTSGSHGFRIAGMRVYKGGKPDQNQDVDEYGYVVSNKMYGRATVKGGNLVEAMRRFIFNPQAGIDDELGKIIAGLFLNDLRRVEEVLASEESRMFSASLLFTFEGDGRALRAALDRTRADMEGEQDNKKEGPYPPGLSASRVDSGIEMDDEGQMVFPMHAAISQNMMLGSLAQAPGSQAMQLVADSDDESMSASSNGEVPRIYSLKLIDFAHAEWTPGQGPDENVLKGVRSLIKIFEELADV